MRTSPVARLAALPAWLATSGRVAMRSVLSLRGTLALFGVVALLGGCGDDVAVSKVGVDKDNDGYDVEVDCDDGLATVNPEADELCNGIDDDCDGEIDEGATDPATFWADTDGDGYGDSAVSTEGCTPPAGYVANDDDCAGDDPTISPDADELCDGIDNDCDGEVDEPGSDGDTYYADADGDGYGDPDVATQACSQPDGYGTDATDCDDADGAVHPGADESDCADPTDYNCDGSVLFADADGDGVAACEDCDDANPDVSPAAAEVCDDADVDEDCDGFADDDDPDATGKTDWYRDADGDGYSGTGTPLEACDLPAGYAAASGDCDDSHADVHPGGAEICDPYDTDEDCDGLTDDDDPTTDASTWNTFYIDADGDGFGDTTSTVRQCDAPAGFTADSTDCDDHDATIHPGGTEICDPADADEDCDGYADDDDGSITGTPTWYADADGDGYGDPGAPAGLCDAPAGYVTNTDDCDDTNPRINPDGAEICDAADADEDCDGAVEELDASCTGKTYFYRDRDGDGHGSASIALAACDLPAGYVTVGDDCNDHDSGVSPDAAEICGDGVDQDCDGADSGC